MSAILLIPPSLEPWTVAEAKSYLRVDHDDDDVAIASLISAARNQVEALTRCCLMTQSWRLVLDRWPPEGRVKPRIGPLQSLTAVRVYDFAGNPNALDAASFVVDRIVGVIAAPGWALPIPGRGVAGIELDIVFGFGSNATDVPDVLRHAIRTLVAHWYENRGLVAIGETVAMLPGSVNAMIASYRVRSL